MEPHVYKPQINNPYLQNNLKMICVPDRQWRGRLLKPAKMLNWILKDCIHGADFVLRQRCFPQATQVRDSSVMLCVWPTYLVSVSSSTLVTHIKRCNSIYYIKRYKCIDNIVLYNMIFSMNKICLHWKTADRYRSHLLLK